MAIKTIITGVLAAGTAAASVGVGARAPITSAPCGPAAGAPVIADALSASQRGVLVARGGHLAVVGGPDVGPPPPAGDESGVVRHVATDPRFGVVYVRDLAGGDDIVIDTPAGETTVHARSEVSHPEWIPDGDIVWGQGGTLRFWSHRTGAVTSSARPVRGGSVFSPVVRDAHAVLAAVTEPPGLVATADEYLSNLWRYDRRDGGWRRVTRFRATSDRWSIIRTPEMGPDGLEFVRVHGRASATTEPTFERWSLHGGTAVKEEALASERYLAGYQGGARLWNMPAPAPDSADWLLERETANGGMQDLGCGAVAVDPVDVTDPDRAAPREPTEPDAEYPIPPPDQPPAHEVAVMVGDFAGENGASNAADRIIDAYGSDAQVKVVDSDHSPLAVKPGSWGAIMWIGYEGDPVNAIQHFWNKLPQFADNSWVVAP
jgi:hypothetical protein